MTTVKNPKNEARNSKSAADRTTTKTRKEIAAELQAVIDPFGWKVDQNAMPHLQAAELDAVAQWLDEPFARTPLAVWTLIVIPNSQWIKYLKNPNDAIAIVSTVFSDRGAFNSPLADPVGRLIDAIDESGHVETRFGGLFLEATPELLIWFGRKAGRTPDLFGVVARKAIQSLFNVAITAAVEKPKSTARTLSSKGIKFQAADKSSTPPTFETVPLSSIVPSKANHRQNFDGDKLQELAESIKQHGILQPILLRLRPDAEPPYEIIAGERRYRAALLAGLDRVPAQIVEREGVAASLAMLEENIRREDLSPIERATAIRSLIDAHGLTQKEVGKMIGVTQGQVSNELRLLDLPPTLQQEVAAGTIAPTLIRTVLPYTDVPDVLENMTAELLSDEDPITEQSLTAHLSGAILKASRSMEYDQHWQSYQAPDTKKRHFKEVSPADLKRLAVRRVESLHTWQGQERTFNVALFDELNAEPLKDRKSKHLAWKKKKTVRTTPAKGKSKPAAVSYFQSEHKLRDAVETDMQRLLAEALGRSKDKTAVLRVSLAFTAATEGAVQHELAGAGFWNSAATRAVLDKLTGSAADMQATLRQAVMAALTSDRHSQTVEESYSYAAALGIEKLWEQWTVTDDLLAALTDAGRAEFIDQIPGHIPEFLLPFFALEVGQQKVKTTKAA